MQRPQKTRTRRPKELRTSQLNVRVKPSTKLIIEEMAAAESRSVSSYIEWLALTDQQRRSESSRK